MEQLKIKYKNLKQALEVFKISAEDFESVKKGTIKDTKNYIRDSSIKRFEFTLDTMWKYLKEYLEKVEMVALKSKSPKSIFKECLQAGIISEEETVKVIEMVDSRNMTSHIYKEEVANIISAKVYEYYKLIEKIVDRTNPNK
jgi:nucleotidyltransferase substrate binding protein (TIGR01987 family)